jgi:hypothetical protein
MNYATPLLDLSNLFGLEEGKIQLNINFEGKNGFMTARLGNRNFLPVFYFGLGLKRKCSFSRKCANMYLPNFSNTTFLHGTFLALKIFLLHVVIRTTRLHNF